MVTAVASVLWLVPSTRATTWDLLAGASAEVGVIFTGLTLALGSLWGRPVWGTWWQWDARLTMAFLLELVFCGYLLVRKFGGPGAEKLAAAMGIFGAATAPFVYKSVDIWRTVHPKTTVIPTLKREMAAPFAFSAIAFVLLSVLVLTLRVHLAKRQAALDALYLAEEE